MSARLASIGEKGEKPFETIRQVFYVHFFRCGCTLGYARIGYDWLFAMVRILFDDYYYYYHLICEAIVWLRHTTAHYILFLRMLQNILHPAPVDGTNGKRAACGAV